jgi:hypothetical protein
LGGTPDDLAGGLTDADKLLLNNAGETADNPGEAVFDGTNFVMRDNAGPFNPRTGGASFDEKVKVSANDTTTDYLGAKVVAGTGVTITEKDDGANETLEVAVTPGGGGGIAHLPAPAQPSLAVSNSWSERASCVYVYDRFNGATTQKWYGYLEFAAGNTMHIRVLRASDGAIVGPELPFTVDGVAEVPITQNLPTVDDAYLVQAKKVGGGGGPKILAGYFEFTGV